MAVIYTLTKKGEIIKTKVKQSCFEIWKLLTKFEPNLDIKPATKDFLLLSDEDGNFVIINKRYIFKIEERGK